MKRPTHRLLHDITRTATRAVVLALAVGLATGTVGCLRDAPPVAAPQVVQEDPPLPAMALSGTPEPELPAAAEEEAPPESVPAAPDPLPPDAPEEHHYTVQTSETIGLYERWSGVPAAEIKDQNGLRKSWLRVGQSVRIKMTPEQAVQFSRMRREFHRRREEAFFRTHEVTQLMAYVVRPGDTLRGVSTRYSEVPRWLMEKVNRGHDLSYLRAGDIINLPVVREVAPGSERDAAARAAVVAESGDWASYELPEPGGPVRVRTTPLAELGDSAVGNDGADAPAWDDGTDGGDGTGAAGAPAAPVKRAFQPPETDGWFSDGEGDPPPPPPVVDVEVKVRKGERLVHYAEWSGVPVSRIAQVNEMLDPGRLKVGQALKIPVEEARVADFYEKRRLFHNGPDPEPPAAVIPAARGARPRAAAAAAGDEPSFEYTVRAGDSAWKIARGRFDIPPSELERLNPDVNWARLRAGQKIRIPGSVVQ